MISQLTRFNNTHVIGLDIGTHSVKMVQMSHGQEGMTATAAAIERIDFSGDGIVSASEKTAQAIKNCIRRTRIKTRNAVCSLAGPRVAVRGFNFPPMPPEQIHAAVMLEASQVCPFNVAKGTVDYQLITAEDRQNEAASASISGVMVAAANEEIEHRRRVTRDAGLHCAIIDSDSLALLNCYNEVERRDKAVRPVILNVGGTWMSLIMQGNDGLPFIRDFNFGGDYIIERIAEEHAIPLETAENAIKGAAGTNHLSEELMTTFSKACGRIARDIIETLKYRTTQSRDIAADEVLICGGFGLTKGFVESMSKLLPIPTRLWNPFNNIRCDADPEGMRVMKEYGPALVVAAGLAMRSL